MRLSYALSISHFVSSVGADAGFAALIGLAILVLLYFAHARETATLRDELLAAEQRLHDLERRPAMVTSATPAPYPKPPMTAATSAAGAAGAVTSAVPATAAAAGGAAMGAPIAAPAGVGAPALIDATRVVPAFEQVPASLEPAPDEELAPAGAERGPGDAELAPAGAEFAAPGAELAPPGADEIESDGLSPRELEALPASAEMLSAGGESRAAVSSVRPLEAPGGTGAVAPPPPFVRRDPPRGPAVGRTPRPVTAAAGGNGSSAPDYGLGPAPRPRSLLTEGLPGRRRRSVSWLIPLLAVVAAGAIAAVVLLVLSGSTTTTPHHSAVKPAKPKIAVAPPGISPSAVTVAVLNGTTVNQLAHHISARLTAKGFKQGILATNTNQAVHTTVVSYLPGGHGDALAVAAALRLPAGDVRPASQSSKSLACPGPALCSAQVIVVVGSDLAP